MSFPEVSHHVSYLPAHIGLPFRAVVILYMPSAAVLPCTWHICEVANVS